MSAIIAPIRPIIITYSPPLPPSAQTTTTTTQDNSPTMPAPMPTRQCGATVRYTPRRRNALVPLPLLPPVPPHVVVKRIAGVVKILAASNVATPEPNDVEMSPVSPPTTHKIQFPVDHQAPEPAAEPATEPVPAPAPAPAPAPPLCPRVRKDSLRITPRFSVPIPSAAAAAPVAAAPVAPVAPAAAPQSTPTLHPIPLPAFPVRPLNFNNLAVNRKPTYEPIHFDPIQWSRPRVPSPLNPSPDSDAADGIPPQMAGLLSISSLPTRALLHPSYFLRARPRPASAVLTPHGAWTLKATLARGGKNDELRRCALMTSESGRKLAWMGGDVRGAVEVWEAEQALEGMEDEEMEFDDELDDITRVYVQPCDDNEVNNQVDDDDDEVVCTGERKAAEDRTPKKECAMVCCPFEFEGPTTCTELDIDMECDDPMEMHIEDGTTPDTHKFTTTRGRTWSDVFEVVDDEDEEPC